MPDDDRRKGMDEAAGPLELSPLQLSAMSDEQVLYAFRVLSNARLLEPGAHLRELEVELERRGLKTLN